MRNLQLRFTLSLACLAAGTAHAAHKGADDTIVVTASRVEQPRDSVGQAITVITQTDIERRQEPGVTELLSTTPGVRFSRAGGVGQTTGISLRGAETNQTLVLIDGVKVNDTSGTGDLFDFGNLMVGNINRIEVLRGSNSVPYGSQAIGGVVNIMTGEPATGLSASGSGEYGYADTLNAKGQIGYGSEKLSAQAGLSWYRTDGISTVAPAFGGTERDGFENIAANVRAKSVLGPLTIDLRGYYIDSDVNYDSYFGTPADSTDRAKTRQYIGYAGATLDLFDGALANRAAITTARTERDYLSPFGTFGFVGENLRFEYQGVAKPVEQAQLVFGYDHEAPEYRGFGFGNSGAKANIDSVYALAIVHPVDALSVTAGVRHDDHSQFGGATTLGANANLGLFGGSTNVRLAYGEGFKAPSLYQLYDPFSGNAALRPEQSKSYDIGIDQKLIGDQARASVTLFHRDTTNLIDYDFTTFAYVNVGKTRVRGLEFELVLQPVDSVSVTGSYSYINAENRDLASPNYGNVLARRARHSVSLSADKQWDSGLSFGATVTHNSGSFSDPANLQQLDGYVLIGLRAAYAINERLELFGRVDNLTDEEYSTVHAYGTPGRAAYGGVRVKL